MDNFMIGSSMMDHSDVSRYSNVEIDKITCSIQNYISSIRILYHYYSKMQPLISKKFYQDFTKSCYGINIRSVYLYANREERAFMNLQSGKIWMPA